MPAENTAQLTEKIDALLPQTQCQRCGYTGCKPYAEAIASNEADINQCPPGGAAGIHRIAALLGREFKPLSPAHGVEGPQQIAVINEQLCIGCALCIQACPVDAIIGASKLMHTVIAEQCTGCELCVPPCPVDCIDLMEKPLNKSAHDEPFDFAQDRPVEPHANPILGNSSDCVSPSTGSGRSGKVYKIAPLETQDHDHYLAMPVEEQAAANAARQRYEFRQFRLERDQRERTERLAALARLHSAIPRLA